MFAKVFLVTFLLASFSAAQVEDSAFKSAPEPSGPPSAITAPQKNTLSRADGVKVAFIGDTGTGEGFQKVLELIKKEKTDLVIALGDLDYGAGAGKWDGMVKKALGDEAALVVYGNHDFTDGDTQAIAKFGQERLNKRPDIKCSGTYAENYSCLYRGVYFVLATIPEGRMKSPTHELFVETQLNAAPEGAWRICGWHKNQRQMQVGSKGNEVGWKAYESCRKKGAIIATAHEHSYSRSLAMSNLENQTVVNPSTSSMNLQEGTSFVFVSGLGGHSIKSQKIFAPHWAKTYTRTQNAKYGAMFATFNENDAHFYFKNIDGQIIDDFKVTKSY